MKFSIRLILALLVLLSIAFAFGAKKFNEYRWYNHEIGSFEIEGGFHVRIWAEPKEFVEMKLVDIPNSSTKKSGLPPITKQVDSPPIKGRAIVMDVLKDGQIRQAKVELHHNLAGSTKNVEVVYSRDRNFVVIASDKNDKLLVLGDLKEGVFKSIAAIWSDDHNQIWNGPNQKPRGWSDMSPGPIRQKWQRVLAEIKVAHPQRNIDWKCLGGYNW